MNHAAPFYGPGGCEVIITHKKKSVLAADATEIVVTHLYDQQLKLDFGVKIEFENASRKQKLLAVVPGGLSGEGTDRQQVFEFEAPTTLEVLWGGPKVGGAQPTPIRPLVSPMVQDAASFSVLAFPRADGGRIAFPRLTAALEPVARTAGSMQMLQGLTLYYEAYSVQFYLVE